MQPTAIDQDVLRSTPDQRGQRCSVRTAAPAPTRTGAGGGYPPSRIPAERRAGTAHTLQCSSSDGRPSSAAVSAPAARGGGMPAPAAVEAGIERARGGGQPLGEVVRGELQPWFTTDLRRVRVHADSDADRLARAVDAVAFTVGSDVFFRGGGYRPQTSAGRALLGHELAHVDQQSGLGATGGLEIGPPDDAFENEAQDVARDIARLGAGTEPAGSRASQGPMRAADGGATRLRRSRTLSRQLIQRRGVPIPSGAIPVPTPTNSVDGSVVVAKMNEIGGRMWRGFDGFDGTLVERQIINAFESSNLQPRSIAIDWLDTRGLNKIWTGTVNIRMENPYRVESGTGSLVGAGGGTGTSGTQTGTSSTDTGSVEINVGGTGPKGEGDAQASGGGKVGGSTSTTRTQGESQGASGSATTGATTSDRLATYNCTIVADISLSMEPDFSGTDYINPLKWGFAGAAAVTGPVHGSGSVSCGSWSYRVSTGFAPAAPPAGVR